MLYQPASLEEALRCRDELRDRAIVVSGGTDVGVAMNRGVGRGSHILDLSRVRGFDSIERSNGEYLLWGGVTFAQAAGLDVRCLAEAARSVGGPQIRNRGTLAGNVASASPAGDASTALLALDADVELTSPSRGPRWLKLTEFFIAYRRTALRDDELITRFRVPAGWVSGWSKLGKRGAVNVSVVACAVGRGKGSRFCVGFASVAPTPLRARRTEGVLSGCRLTEAVIEEAARAATSEVAPIDDHRSSAEYRRAMCGVLLARVLRDIRNQCGEA